MSGMPMPAVHCFACILLFGAFMVGTLVIVNLRAEPPYFFINTNEPLLSGGMGFGAW